MFASRIIFLLIIVSGAVAFIGDRVGHYIGRKRLSIFGIRPRYTAVAVTVISGILITVITFSTFIFLSREARLALFGLEELRERIMTLEGIKSKLEREVEVSRKGSLVFQNGDVILSTLIAGGQDSTAIEIKLKQIIGLLDLNLKSSGIISKEKNLVTISNDNIKKTIKDLSNRRNDQVLQVKVMSNVVYGENVPVQFNYFDNCLLFRNGQELNRATVSQKLSDPEIEQQLKILLSEARVVAEKKGVIPDLRGSVGSITYAEIFNTVKTIKNREGEVVVRVVVNRPVYTIGPLSVEFKL
jgi:uncharacterized protein (DUF3084 family)